MVVAFFDCVRVNSTFLGHDLLPFVLIYIYIYSLVTTIRFSQPAFTANENSEEAEVVLQLSNPLSSDLIVEVITSDDTALGEYYSMYMNYCNSIHNVYCDRSRNRL